ncbi:tumor necrosis factor receptor superfamily member 16-like [Dreissena polymorpha]|uniref:TNFR-Cys domain-containing protein n=1 Tax=Dreissena polymorpha TaxID=45954 RepID=A0A9D4H901_DREPO|nr:tumor necrosis factor receptor superfamily member 16-like [Dreissena polymorpha]KAH3830695.1 hypothetical protein DPMN_103941 [Dreissena polymorpha]
MDRMSTNVVCMFAVMLQMSMENVHALMPHYMSMIQCPARSFYDVTRTDKDKCSPCMICPEGFQIKENCTGTRDTVCEICAPGTFNDVKGGKCRNCSVCFPGQYTQRHCRAHKDAMCRKCPQFTFSSRPNVGVCRYCRTCFHNQEELSPCRRNRDRKCGRCKTGFFRRPGGGGCLQCSQCLPEVLAPRVKACMHQKVLDPEQTCFPTEVAEMDAMPPILLGNTGDILTQGATKRLQTNEERRTTRSQKGEEGKQVYGSFLSTTLFTTTVDDLPDVFSWRIAAWTGSTVAIFVLLLIALCFVLKKINIDFKSDPPYFVRL